MLRARCPRLLPDCCFEVADYAHSGPLASRYQPLLAFLDPVTCHRLPANNCGNGRRLAPVASLTSGHGRAFRAAGILSLREEGAGR